MIFEDISRSIGRTPLVRLNRITNVPAVAVACQVAARPLSKGKLIVTVLPDAEERYPCVASFDVAKWTR